MQCQGFKKFRLASRHGQTRFIVFLSTPHSGAGMANWLQYMGKLLRASVSVKELEAHHPQLRQLNIWYRDHVADMGIKNFVYCEEHKTGRLPLGIGGILVVDKTSADPGIPGVTPIPLDEDHISICKPARDGERARVYRQVKLMIEELVNVSLAPPAIRPQLQPEPLHQTGTKPMRNVTYSGKVKIEVCNRLHNDWQTLADQLEIPEHDRGRFGRGFEPQSVWEWLKNRGQLAKLAPALAAIGRSDLVEVLRNPQ